MHIAFKRKICYVLCSVKFCVFYVPFGISPFLSIAYKILYLHSNNTFALKRDENRCSICLFHAQDQSLKAIVMFKKHFRQFYHPKEYCTFYWAEFWYKYFTIFLTSKTDPTKMLNRSQNYWWKQYHPKRTNIEYH